MVDDYPVYIVNCNNNNEKLRNIAVCRLRRNGVLKRVADNICNNKICIFVYVIWLCFAHIYWRIRIRIVIYGSNMSHYIHP